MDPSRCDSASDTLFIALIHSDVPRTTTAAKPPAQQPRSYLSASKPTNDFGANLESVDASRPPCLSFVGCISTSTQRITCPLLGVRTNLPDRNTPRTSIMVRVMIIQCSCPRVSDQRKIVSAIASVINCAVKFVNSLARRQHLFDIVAKPINIDSNFRSYPAPLFLFCFNFALGIFPPGDRIGSGVRVRFRPGRTKSH